jgi:RNA polymerase sigma-70 factor (ECF subfamily)
MRPPEALVLEGQRPATAHPPKVGHARPHECLVAQGPAVAGRQPLPPDDQTSLLLARLADGDRGVSSELFHVLWSPVRRLARSLLQHEADADDAAQDAMITIFARASDYDRRRAGMPWALAIAGFSCRTHRQKRARRREESDGAAHQLSTDSPSADEEIEKAELVAAAMGALDALTDVDRETLVATYWEERSASASGATLRKRRERALDRIRRIFRRFYGLG